MRPAFCKLLLHVPLSLLSHRAKYGRQVASSFIQRYVTRTPAEVDAEAGSWPQAGVGEPFTVLKYGIELFYYTIFSP